VKNTDAAAAAMHLRDLLGEIDHDAYAASPGQGCCGCGAWMADVRTPGWSGAPRGEGYCWACVDRMSITEYVVLEGRRR
jgi:hypothetical protein